jgi:hypothetical protein
MSEKKQSSDRPKAVKRRSHGYRGYGSGARGVGYGGAVHWGRGFGGVGYLEGGGSPTLLEAGLFTENLKEKTSKS